MYSVMVDGSRRVFLVTDLSEEHLRAVTMMSGTLEYLSIARTEVPGLEVLEGRSPEDFARVCLSTTLGRTPEAVRILMGAMGLEIPREVVPSIPPPRSRPTVTEGLVTLSEICDQYKWSSSEARRMLRRNCDRPPGGWVWSQDEVEEIVDLLKSFLGVTK